MKTMETSRLLLRKFTENDFDAVHSYASVKENIIFMPWGPNSMEQTQDFVRMAIAKANENPCTKFEFAATLKESGKLIGACGIVLPNTKASTGHIGWILHRDYWKQGYGTEMGNALLKFAFEELNLHRIVAHCDNENSASYHIMEKIGMRREGLFLEACSANKLSTEKYSDELVYAILKKEYDIQKEIAYYNNLPVVFHDFINLSAMLLTDNEIHLVCTAKNNAVPEKKHVPSYDFAICKGSEKIGEINLRIGYTAGLYYGGQIGYSIDERHRGNGYAVRGCRLLASVAKAHGMKKLLITNDYQNNASKRVCEKLGAKLLRLVHVPEWHPLHTEGQKIENIFEWTIE